MNAINKFQEKCNTNKYLTKLFILLATIGMSSSAIGQNLGPPFDEPNFIPANSIDDNLWILVLIGLLLGFHLIKKESTNKLANNKQEVRIHIKNTILKKHNQHPKPFMRIKSLFFMAALISSISLFGQVKNTSVLYVKDNSIFYVNSNTIDFSQTATSQTTRSASNYGTLIINSTATWSGASNSHYADGFVRTLNSNSFTFPIGQSGTYAPARINFSTTGTADAAYFNTAASSVGTTMDNSVTSISTIEYWKIASTNSATISLTWRAASAISTLTNATLTDLIIIGWNGTNWVQIPSAVDTTSILDGTSSLTSGSITSTISITPNAYQAFSLGNKGEACAPIVVSSGIPKTWNGTSWSPSAPTLSDPAVISAAYSGNLACNSLTLNADITLGNGELVEIVNGATGDGKIIMASQASVVQRTSNATAPKIQLTKITNLMRRFDYVFLSSPINDPTAFYNNLSSNQSAAVNGNFGTYSQSAFQNLKSLDDTGNVQVIVTTVPIGKGVRAWVKNQAPYSASTTSGSWNTEKLPIHIKIDGVANNGDVSVTVPSNSWAFVGNPYPSAIDGAKLLKAAGTNVRQTIYYWTFNTPITPMGYFTTNDWASWTVAGGVAACAGCTTPDGSIASMQSVYIKASNATPTTFNITNCMRKTINNTMFFKTQPKDRFWVNMNGIDDNSFSQILLAYSEDATVLEDPELDGERFATNGTLLSSLIGETKYAIQARPTFSPEDVVPLAVNQLNNQNCTISLGNKEGVFSTDNISIFLHDIQLGVYHDLTLSDYTFIQSSASDTTRFEIAYQNPALNNDAFNTNKCVAFVASGELKIQASKTINSIAIYDITGRKITEYFPNSRVYSHSFFHSIGVYFAKITFDDKSIATQKVVNGTK